ncbi:MAG: hypothetical protein PWP23_2733 [Candidatus Sumerlaeota bacterium]|nr:hypothetical protein [Candidatus Sumerlaeota bacterium]
MAMGAGLDLTHTLVVAVFLFIAVWLPCCTSDIVFPLLFSKERVMGSAANPENFINSNGKDCK